MAGGAARQSRLLSRAPPQGAAGLERHTMIANCARRLGAGGIVPFEAKAMEGIVVHDQTLKFSRWDNRRAMDLKPMAPRSNGVTGLMKRRRPSDRFAHATRAIHLEDRRQVTLYPPSRPSLRCGARRPAAASAAPAHRASRPEATDSTSSGVIRMTGMAFGWIGATMAFASVVRKPSSSRDPPQEDRGP